MIKSVILSLSAVAVTVMAVSPAAHANGLTTARFIGDLGRGSSQGTAINNTGIIAGYSPDAAGNYRGFIWDGSMQDIGVAGLNATQNVQVSDINDSKTVVGAATFAGSGNVSAYLKQYGGAYVQIPLLPGMVNGYATAVNEAGDIVGYNTDYDGNVKAFMYKNGMTTPLADMGSTEVRVHDINDSGQAVGSIRLADWSTRAVMWEGGGVTDLGAPDGCSSARAINNKAQIVGTSNECVKASARPALWDGGTLKPLGLLPLHSGASGSYAYATDINDAGQIVGHGRVKANTPYEHEGLMWTVQDRLPARLFDNTVVYTSEPASINNKGEITGSAYWKYTDGSTSTSESGAFYAMVDSVPPTVQIVSPLNSKRQTPNSTAHIAVDADDEGGVRSVEIYFNDVLLCTEAAPPYSCSYKVPTPNTAYVLKARAYDVAGNSSETQTAFAAKNKSWLSVIADRF